ALAGRRRRRSEFAGAVTSRPAKGRVRSPRAHLPVDVTRPRGHAQAVYPPSWPDGCALRARCHASSARLLVREVAVAYSPIGKAATSFVLDNPEGRARMTPSIPATTIVRTIAAVILAPSSSHSLSR